MILRTLRNLTAKKGTLHGQAISRLAIVLVISMVGIMLIGLSSYAAFYQREASQKQALIEGYYLDKLPRLESEWQTEAEQIKARIEFSRILEDTADLRWAKLNALLNAQWEFINFSNLLILDGQGKVLFRFGTEAHALNNIAALSSGWLYAKDRGEFYQVFQRPLWLGQGGQGSLLLLKSINNAVLKKLEIPETHLHLKFDSALLASSSALPKGATPFDSSVFYGINPHYVETALSWPGSDKLQLVIQREIHTSYPLPDFLLRPVMAVVFVAILLWLGLGRWLQSTVLRVESVSAAARRFADSGRLRLAESELEPAQSRKDEIGDLALSLQSLLQIVDTREHEQKAYLGTLALLEEAVLELDCDGRIQRASPGWSTLAHCDDAVGRKLDEFIHVDDLEALHIQCDSLIRGMKSHMGMRLRLGEIDGLMHNSWLECRFVSYWDESGKVAGLRGVLRDVTQTYLQEKQISHMALHDALTELPNRVLLEDRFKVALRLASRTVHKVGVCFIDLDHFKNINDTLGHKVGDRLLQAFSVVLNTQLRAGDTLARWGGDEFVLLLPDMQSEDSVRETIKKVREVMQSPLNVDGADLSVTFSMGVAIYPDDGEEVETLFSEADRAMFYAKSQGRNQVCFFRDMTSQGIGKKELYIQNRLVNAVSSQRIQAWYQPIIEASTGACSGVEVLARWHDDELGWIGPATFIPIAESIGVIRELGQQVWLASLTAAESWQRQGLALSIAVNVSKRELFKPYFTEQLLEEVSKHQLSPGNIILEVTESIALLDVEHAAERLQELKEAGFRIAIDDFG
ncbi:MAG: diguanylate cyclase, partial [Gammaproteobacteria bacterium]|nr:diguanylate cyclase [Gammaproteobacteria bacterium]